MSGSCKPTQPTAPEAAGALRAAAAASGASVRKRLQSASPRPRPESSSFDVLLVSSLPKSFRGGSQTSESAAFAGAGGPRPARRERERLGDVALSALTSSAAVPTGSATPHHGASEAAASIPRWCGRRLVPLLSPLRGGAAPIPFKVFVLKEFPTPPKVAKTTRDRSRGRLARPPGVNPRVSVTPRPAGASARASRESPRLAHEGPVGATGPRVAFGCEFESEGPHVTVAA